MGGGRSGVPVPVLVLVLVLLLVCIGVIGVVDRVIAVFLAIRSRPSSDKPAVK